MIWRCPIAQRNVGQGSAAQVTSIRPKIPLHYSSRPQSTAPIPYRPDGRGESNECLGRPRKLTHGGNFATKSTVSQNSIRRSECESQRGENRALRMRLRYPPPEDPLGPTEVCSGDAVRLETLGCTYLESAEVMANSAAWNHIHSEMMRLRRVYRNPRYMHHWEEYRDAYKNYIGAARDPPPLKTVSSVCASYRLTERFWW